MFNTEELAEQNELFGNDDNDSEWCDFEDDSDSEWFDSEDFNLPEPENDF